MSEVLRFYYVTVSLYRSIFTPKFGTIGTESALARARKAPGRKIESLIRFAASIYRTSEVIRRCLTLSSCFTTKFGKIWAESAFVGASKVRVRKSSCSFALQHHVALQVSFYGTVHSTVQLFYAKNWRNLSGISPCASQEDARWEKWVAYSLSALLARFLGS